MSEIVTAPDFVQPASIDFNSLYQKAMDHPADPTADAEASAPELVSSSADVAPAIPDTPLNSAAGRAEGTPGQVIDLPDDALVRVKIDGVEQTVPYREYKDGIQREAAFTKRMQQLADQRREAEQVFTQRAAELQRQAEMLQYAQQQLQQQSNPVAQLQQLLQQQQQAQMATPSADPNEIATLGEVQQALKAFEQTFAQQQAAQQQAFLQQLQETGQQLKYEQALEADAATFTNALTRTLDTDDYRVLRDTIPFAEESIRFQVAQLNPQTMDEAISFMEQVAKEWSGKVRAASTEQIKRQEVAKARAKMEPPAGSPVPPVQARPKAVFKKNGQTDWDALRERASAYLDS